MTISRSCRHLKWQLAGRHLRWQLAEDVKKMSRMKTYLLSKVAMLRPTSTLTTVML